MILYGIGWEFSLKWNHSWRNWVKYLLILKKTYVFLRSIKNLYYKGTVIIYFPTTGLLRLYYLGTYYNVLAS